MSASALDVFTGPETDEAAGFLIRFGLLAALPTAAAGLSDWADTEGARPSSRSGSRRHQPHRRVALRRVFAGSPQRQAPHGNGSGGRGWTRSTTGGYVGGHLSLGKGIGVDRTAFEEGPREWTVALDDGELVEGQPKLADVDGRRVTLLRRAGRIYGLVDRCNHLGGPLHKGEIRHGTVTCPWHASMFSFADGAVVRGPARAPQPAYETRVRDGKIEVRVASR